MSTKQRSLGDVTLNEMLNGLARYRPFVLAVAAVILVVAFLPGKPANTSRTGTTGSVAAGPSAASAGPAAADAGTGAANPSATALAATSAGTGASSGGTSVRTAASGAARSAAAPPPPSTDPACDPATGRIKVPTLFAAPCMPPFSGSNGGATYQGVTDSTITVAVPYAQPNAASKAILASGGDTDSDQQIQQNQNDYVNFFEHHYQTYGRKVKLQFFTSNVNPNDSTAAQNSEAQADANIVAKQYKAFASLGDAADPQAFHDTLVANKVMCFCTVTLPASYYLQRAPYIWGTGLPDETQDYQMRAEVLCDEINPYPPQFVGGVTNPETGLKPPVLTHRVYALMWPGDPSNTYKPGADFFQQRLKDECGLTFKDVVSFQLSDVTNPGQAQQEAQTFMAKFSADNVSSIVFVGDPITPVYFTGAATQQQYFPEWIQTGSALTDTAFFGRLYDQQQWVHNFGFSALGDRVPQNLSDAYNLYNWQFNAAPSAPGTYTTIYPDIWMMMTGIMLAGPNLTPATFRCGQPPYTSQTIDKKDPCVGQTYPGLFGFPVSPTNWKQRVTNPVIAFGDKLWPWDDYNQSDDGTLIWWDPNASGPTETGVQGNGLYRFVNNGARYMYGQFPKGQVPWFDPTNTALIFSDLPPADKPPSYKYACYYLCNSPGN